jgi:hypothetical protein
MTEKSNLPIAYPYQKSQTTLVEDDSNVVAMKLAPNQVTYLHIISAVDSSNISAPDK